MPVVAWLILIASASAQTDDQEFYRKQFAGWGTIVFRCLPGNESDAVQERLCASAGAEARLLAATAKIPFRDMGSKSWFDVVLAAKELNVPLMLEAELRATRGTPRAISMELKATSYYSNAVEQGAVEGSADAIPRSGDLVLWSKYVLSSGGSETELVQGTSNAFATILKEFFGLFIESRN